MTSTGAISTAPPKYSGIFQTAALVTREEGPFALWKGNGAFGAMLLRSAYALALSLG